MARACMRERFVCASWRGSGAQATDSGRWGT
jgi:hypothetical protein